MSTELSEKPPSPDVASTTRVHLRDLTLPPEVLAEVDRACKRYWPGKEARRQAEDEAKLQYYFGGQAVYVLRSPNGPVVIPIPEHHKNTEGLRYVLFTPEERSEVGLVFPSRWNERDGAI